MDSLPFTNRRTQVADYCLDLISAQAQFSGQGENFFPLYSSQIGSVIVPDNEKHLKVSNSLPPHVTLQVILTSLICFLLRKPLRLKCCFVLEIIKHFPLKAVMEFLKLSCIILFLAFLVLDVIFHKGTFQHVFLSTYKLLTSDLYLFKLATHQFLLLPFSVSIRLKDHLFQPLTRSMLNRVDFWKSCASFRTGPTVRHCCPKAPRPC